MADVLIDKYRVKVVRQGTTPANPGNVTTDPLSPVNPGGGGGTFFGVGQGLSLDSANKVKLGGSNGVTFYDDATITQKYFELAFPGFTSNYSSTFYTLLLDDVGNKVSQVYIENSNDPLDVVSKISSIVQNDEATLEFKISDSGPASGLDFSTLNGLVVLDQLNSKGLVYNADYSANGTLDNRWIPDWGAVQAAIAGGGSSKWTDVGVGNIYRNSSVSIGQTADPTNTLDVNGTVRVRTVNNATGDFVTVSGTGVLQKRTAAEVRTDISAVGGSGTTNYVSKFTAASTLGNSQIFDNGTSVGINTAAPSASYKLDVSGTGRFTDALSFTGGTPVPGSVSYSPTFGLVFYGNTGTTCDLLIGDRTGAIKIGIQNGSSPTVLTNQVLIGATSIAGANGIGFATSSGVRLTRSGTYGLQLWGDPSSTTYGLSLYGNNGDNGLLIKNNGDVVIGTFNQAHTGEKLNVAGSLRVQSVSNATGNFVTLSATGVLQQRTAAEVVTDLGGVTGLWTLVGSDIYRNSAVAVGRTIIPANATFAVQSISATGSHQFFQLLNNSGTVLSSLSQEGSFAVNTTPQTNIFLISRSSTDTDASASFRTLNSSNTLTFQITGSGIRSAVRHGFGGSTGYTDAAATFRTFPLSTNFSIFIENFAGSRTVAVPNSGAWQSLAGAFFGSSNIGIAPTGRVDIRGVGTGTGITLLLEDSTGANTFEFLDNGNLSIPSTNGAKFGTTTSQKLAFWNATPIVQPTTAIAAAAFVANTSGIANDTATFGGYTLGQVVQALRNIGILA